MRARTHHRCPAITRHADLLLLGQPVGLTRSSCCPPCETAASRRRPVACMVHVWRECSAGLRYAATHWGKGEHASAREGRGTRTPPRGGALVPAMPGHSLHLNTHHGVGVVDVNVVVLPAGRLFNKRLVDARAVLLHIILLLLIRMCGEISKSFESVCMSKVSWISEGWFHSCACTRPGVGGWVQGMHDTHACTPCVTAGCLRVPRSSSSADDEDFGLSEPPLQPHAQ